MFKQGLGDYFKYPVMFFRRDFFHQIIGSAPDNDTGLSAHGAGIIVVVPA